MPSQLAGPIFPTPCACDRSWMGDNLIKKSENMTWWTGVDVETPKGKVSLGRLNSPPLSLLSPG